MADDDAAAALLAKHKSYAGWEYGDGSVRSIKLFGSIAERAKDGTLKTTYRVEELRAGLIHRRNLTKVETGRTFDAGYTGNVFWNSSGNGFTVPDRSEDTKYAAARSAVFDETTTALPAVVAGHGTIAGVAVVILREKIPNVFPIDLYVDPQTGAYKRVVLDPGDKPETIDIDAYAEPVPGKRVISVYHFSDAGDERTFDKIELNAQIDAADLHPPQPSASWTFGSSSPIPIELRAPDFKSGSASGEAGYRLYASATVNGVQGRFIVDTGADGIALSPDFAKRAKVTHVSHERIAGIGSYSSENADIDRVDSIAFADGSTLHNVLVGSGVDLGDERADGLLGFDFMGGAIVAFDLDANRMQIFDPAKVAPSEDGAIVALPDLSEGQPVLPMVVDGSAKGNVTVDTGSPGFALLSSGYLTKVPVMIDNSSLGSTIAFAGATGGSEIDRCGALAEITIGPIHYNHVQTCFSRNWDAGTGLIGLDFMQHFNFTLDYPDGKIVMYKRAH